jgi:DNA-binding response OmpR family regulator
MDGVEVLLNLEGHLSKTSVLVISGRSGLEERVRCFHLGADQVLPKPFSFLEFTARCKALGRRRLQIVDTSLRHRGVELNRMDRKVTREGESVELTGKEFALLEYLMQARGRCCTRSELLREVWQMSPDAGTNVVDVYVNYLRKKLVAAKPGSSKSGMDEVIQTVRGSGYRMGAGQQKKPVQRSLPGEFAGVGTGPERELFGVVDGGLRTPQDHDPGTRRIYVA